MRLSRDEHDMKQYIHCNITKKKTCGKEKQNRL